MQKTSEKKVQQFDFLRSYVEELFAQTGFAKLTDQTKRQYIPQFAAEAERRLGLALLPHLDEAAARELVKLVESETVTPEKLKHFWQTNVPDFDAIVQKTLADFAVELQKVIQQSSPA